MNARSMSAGCLATSLAFLAAAGCTEAPRAPAKKPVVKPNELVEIQPAPAKEPMVRPVRPAPPLKTPKPIEPVEKPAPPPAPKIEPDEERKETERLAWAGVQKLNTLEAYEAFLETFPKSEFAPLAKAATDRLKLNEDFERLKAACIGKGVAEAAAFDWKKPGVHPMVMMTNHGELHPWHFKIPPEWRSQSLDTTEFVVVIGPRERTVLEVVLYTGPSITRYREILPVVIVEAKTGRRRAKAEFFSDPRPAQRVEAYELTVLAGTVTLPPVQEWMRRHVIVPDALLFFDPNAPK